VPLAPEEPGSALEPDVLLPLVPLKPGVLGSSLALLDWLPLRLVAVPLVPEVPADVPLPPEVVVPALLVSLLPLVPLVPEALEPRPLRPLLPLVPLVSLPLVPLVPRPLEPLASDEDDEVALRVRPAELEELLPCVPAICCSC